jgi:hypothetical protein
VKDLLYLPSNRREAPLNQLPPAPNLRYAVTISRRLGSFNFAFVAHNPADGVLI